MMSLSETVVSGHIMVWKLSCFLDMGVWKESTHFPGHLQECDGLQEGST
jgi:hypothetical protein